MYMVIGYKETGLTNLLFKEIKLIMYVVGAYIHWLFYTVQIDYEWFENKLKALVINDQISDIG